MTLNRGGRAAREVARKRGAFFEFNVLPLEQRESLCRELLAEFGVNQITATHKHELIHSCCLPFGQHKNGDRNPSASLNYETLTYNCLGCGSGGGFLWFIATCRGEETFQARDWLVSETGLGQTILELDKLLSILDQMYSPSAEVRPPIPSYDPAVLTPWTWDVHHPYLTDGAPELGFTGRHIPESTLDRFHIGYAPQYYDHTERIIIPLWWQGKLVGWQARHIDADGKKDKYRNSPDFPKDQALYNFEPRRRCVVVESPLSVLRHFHHQPMLTGTFGASLTDIQVRLLHQAPEVVLWFDNDTAGWRATREVGTALEPYLPVWTTQSPYAADPADLPDELVDELIADAVPFSLWTPPAELTPWKGY